MIYAIILMCIGVLLFALNKSKNGQSYLIGQLTVGIIGLIYGIVGVVIMNTARRFVLNENPLYWTLLVVGCSISIVLGTLVVYKYIQTKRSKTNGLTTLSTRQNSIAVLAIIVGVLTLLAVVLKSYYLPI
ncbi:MAG: hypothetical protein RL662_521 [Bacteroidota bacterium]